MDVSSLADALPGAGAHARLSSAAPGRGAAGPSADDLAILDAVRDDAVARFTARLAPAPGAPTYGTRDVPAPAASARADPISAPTTLGDVRAALESRAVAAETRSRVSADETRRRASSRSVSVAALNAEVRRQARLYIERREAEFWAESRGRARNLAETEMENARARLDPNGESDGSRARG